MKGAVINMGKIGSGKGASRSSAGKSSKSSASKKTQTSKSPDKSKGSEKSKEAGKAKETQKNKETKDEAKLSEDAKGEDPGKSMRVAYGFTPPKPDPTRPDPTEPKPTEPSTGQGSNAINDKLDDILKALQDAMKPKEEEKAKECGGGSGEGGGGEGGGGDKAKDAGSAGGPQMNPNQGKQDWDMIINADCDRVLQAAGTGGMMGQQGIQGMTGMQGIGGVQGVGGMGSGMNPVMGGTMGMPGGGTAGMQGMGGSNLIQVKQQLQTDLQTAQGQGWQPRTPQLKQKLQLAQQAGGDVTGQQQGMQGMGVMTPGQSVPGMGPGRMI